jgi:hypothetical protein
MLILMLYKMGEYREQANAAAQPPPVPAAQGSSNVPAFMTLAAQYGLEDDDLGFGNNNTGHQTLEQEYQTYITAPLSNLDFAHVKYWEVRWS